MDVREVDLGEYDGRTGRDALADESGDRLLVADVRVDDDAVAVEGAQVARPGRGR
jgi:hypothetical protein